MTQELILNDEEKIEMRRRIDQSLQSGLNAVYYDKVIDTYKYMMKKCKDDAAREAMRKNLQRAIECKASWVEIGKSVDKTPIGKIVETCPKCGANQCEDVVEDTSSPDEEGE